MFHKFKAGADYFVDGRLRWSLTVNPEQRLGSGLPEEDPAVVFEEYL